MKVINCYLSKGKSNIDGKDVKWDNVVFECLDNNFISNADFTETSVFGGKVVKLKVNRERFEKIFTGKILELQGKDIELLYNSKKELVQILAK